MDDEIRGAMREIDVSRLNHAFRLVKSGSNANSQIWIAKPDRFAMGILLDGHDDKAKELLLEEEVSVFEALFPNSVWEVECATMDSMVSGKWGMKSFRIAERGYFFEEPDWGAGTEPFRLLGSWAPSNDRETYRRAFVETYVRAWKVIGLPPFLGQVVNGPLDLMVEALMRIGGPKSLGKEWSDQVRQVIGDIDPKEVAEVLGLPTTIVEEAHTHIGRGALRTDVGTDEAMARAVLALHLIAMGV